jgi:hypothetical protein
MESMKNQWTCPAKCLSSIIFFRMVGVFHWMVWGGV